MTLSPPQVLIGEQSPRVATAPESLSTAGKEAVELAGIAGIHLDPWQRLVLDVMLGERADGRWSAYEVAYLVARQNGKGEVLLARELYGLLIGGENTIVHTAHEFKTCLEGLLKLQAAVESVPTLSKRVRTIRTSNGKEAVEFKTGQRVLFMARSRKSGRGFTADTIIFDEAQELTTSAVGALLPTLTTAANPQVIYTGTVPTPENNAEHFTRLRDRGRAGGDSTLAWLEWSAGETKTVDIDDRAGWARSNPALGFRVSEEGIERDRNTLGPDDFYRERLSVWPEEQGRSVIDASDWVACRSTGKKQDDYMEDPVCLGVDLTPDRSWGSIVAAGASGEGPFVALDVIDHREGAGWIVERVAQLVNDHKPRAVLIDPQSAAGSLIRDLTANGVEVTECKTDEVKKATGDFYDAVKGRKIRHLAQPVLESAVAGATRRTVGDSWMWDRRAGTVVAPLVAATLARWGHVEAPEAPSIYETRGLVTA